MTNRITILVDTFAADGTSSFGTEVGTVQVDLGRQTLTARARRNEYGISVGGFVGRYQTSAKPWIASVSLGHDGRMFANFGRDDRSGRFNKMNAISWAPDTFWTLADKAAFYPAGEA